MDIQCIFNLNTIHRSLCCAHGNHVWYQNLLPSRHYSDLLQDLFYYTTPQKANSASTRTRGTIQTKQRDEELGNHHENCCRCFIRLFCVFGFIFLSLCPFGCPCNYRPQYCNNQFFTLHTYAYVLQFNTKPCYLRLKDKTNSDTLQWTHYEK